MPNALMDLATFREDFPEFETASDTLVQKVLTKAGEQFDSSVWGTYLQTGHGLLTAHLLAIAPQGQFARLDTDKAQTTYGAEYQKLLAAVTCCIRTF